jgi:acyl-coenzyme A thioesterase PaaI-like protein
MDDHSNPRNDRLSRMQAEIEKNPFVSDEELAALLSVSIHTVRSDRRKIGIPEVRKRGRDFSEGLFGQARALSHQDIIGDLLEVDPDKEGLSLLDTNEQMGLRKTGIVRGHIIFAQANTLANAVVDAEIALTGQAKITYLAPVFVGERILAKAKVIAIRKRRKEVEVIMKTKKKLVFEGTFTIYCLNQDLAAHLNVLSEVESEGAKK